jgi:Xaa-Pro aminopeptidase
MKHQEAIGSGFSMSAMIRARDLTFEAVEQIGAAIKPGMTEEEALALAQKMLEQLHMERLWHRNIIRFGESTLMTHRDFDQPNRVLGDNDIFFIDIGVVWDGHEGDAGDTFVLGDDVEMHACAKAAREIWEDVAARWRSHRLSGTELYAFADAAAQALGWRLNMDIKGHRVCDFPHAIYRAGELGDFALCPSTGLWILEIQIAHPTRPFGGFYEDLLVMSPGR